MKRGMRQDTPYDAEFFFARYRDFFPGDRMIEGSLMSFGFDHEILHFLYDGMYICFCHGLDEIFFHIFFVPSLYGYTEAIYICECDRVE